MELTIKNTQNPHTITECFNLILDAWEGLKKPFTEDMKWVIETKLPDMEGGSIKTLTHAYYCGLKWEVNDKIIIAFQTKGPQPTGECLDIPLDEIISITLIIPTI